MTTPSGPSVSELPTIIFQLGSWNLRANMATHLAPVTIPHCIARVRPNKNNDNNGEIRQIYAWESAHETLEEREEANQMLVAHISKVTPIIERAGHLKSTESGGKCSTTILEVSAESAAANAAAIALQPILFGDRALNLPVDAPYTVKFPIHGGRINWSQYPSMREVEQDLLLIWQNVIANELLVPLDRLSGYTMALLVPDLISARELALFVRLILVELKFAGVFVLRQSVCAAVGAARVPSCVVDVGHTRTSIACVAESQYGGLDIIRASAFNMRWGGHHVTRLLQHTLAMSELPGETWWPWRTPDAVNFQHSVTHYLAVTKLKENVCNLVTGGKNKFSHVSLATRDSSLRATTYNFSLNAQQTLALRYGAYSLLYPPPSPDLVQRGEHNPLSSHLSHDPEDYKGLAYVRSRAHQLSDAASALKDWLGVDAERLEKKRLKRERENMRDSKQLGTEDEDKERKRAERKRKRSVSVTATPTTVVIKVNDKGQVQGQGQLASQSQDQSAARSQDQTENKEESDQAAVQVKEETSAPARTSPFPRAGKHLRAPPPPPPDEEIDAMDIDSDLDLEGEPSEEDDLEELPANPLSEKTRIRFTLPPPPRQERSRVVNIARAILESIAQVKDPIARASCAEAVVLTGGAAQGQGVLEAIEDALVDLAPRDLPRLHVITPKEVSAEQGGDASGTVVRYAWYGAQKLLQFVEPGDFIDAATWNRLGPYATLRSRLHFSPDDADALL